MTVARFYRRLMCAAALAAAMAISTTSTLPASGAVAPVLKRPMAIAWSGVVSDDETNTYFDYQTGLGIFVGCFLEIVNKRHRNRLDIQFSYTLPQPKVLKMVADVRKDITRSPQPRIVKTLDSTTLKQWDYIRYIPSCDDRYYIYVGFPK